VECYWFLDQNYLKIIEGKGRC